MDKEYKYMVCTRCITYNHAPYIEDTLKGFAMQETTFPVVHCVIDDASTDGEQDVIRKYIKINSEQGSFSGEMTEETDSYSLIFMRHKDNKNCFFAVYLLKYNLWKKPDGGQIKEQYFARWHNQSKYAAMCEGDDYWIHPQKLQRQVEYLESHDGYGMVYTPYRQYFQSTATYRDVYTDENVKYDDNFKWDILEQKVVIGTCTPLVDAELYKSVCNIKDDYEGFLMGDTQTWFNLARLSKVGYIPEVMGVYRKHMGGATATFDTSRRAKFINACLDLDLHLAYKYGAPKRTVHVVKKLFGLQCFNLYFRTKDYEGARKVNDNYFYSNHLIGFIINIAQRLKIKNIHGLGTILRTAVKCGIIKLD